MENRWTSKILQLSDNTALLRAYNKAKSSWNFFYGNWDALHVKSCTISRFEGLVRTTCTSWSICEVTNCFERLKGMRDVNSQLASISSHLWIDKMLYIESKKVEIMFKELFFHYSYSNFCIFLHFSLFIYSLFLIIYFCECRIFFKARLDKQKTTPKMTICKFIILYDIIMIGWLSWRQQGNACIMIT